MLAITGASGAIYALRLLQVLLAAGAQVHLSISPSGGLVLKQELGIELDLKRFRPRTLPLTADRPGDAAAGDGRSARSSRGQRFGGRGRSRLPSLSRT